MHKGVTWSSLLFLAFLAILPFAYTTALRNVILLFLTSALVFVAARQKEKIASELFHSLPIFFVLWVLFLLIFPALMPHAEEEWPITRGQWWQSVLTWIISLFLVRLGGVHDLSFPKICFAAGLVVLAYFLQIGLAALGLSGYQLSFPFYGYDEMHGNLGYAASQLVVISAAWFGVSESNNSSIDRLVSLGLVMACLCTAILTASRGALIYDFFMLVISYLFLSNKNQKLADYLSLSFRTRLALIIGLIFLVGLFATSVSKSERWQLLFVKLQAGFVVEDPLKAICNGLDDDDKNKVLQKLLVADADKAEKVITGLGGDGGRVLLMRVGWQLVKENPLGIDGSRQAYEKAITAKCGGQPVNTFAHTHNGWMNLALSLGWLGAALYFTLLASMAYEGFKQARRGVALPWSSALFLVAFFWIIRGLTDACYQDHYLLMQGIMLGFLYMRTRMPANEVAIS